MKVLLAFFRQESNGDPKMANKSISGSLIATINIIIVASFISAISGSSYPVTHSLASFATTNSFLYSKNFGAQNYRLAKPQPYSFTKFIGYPQQQTLGFPLGHTSTFTSTSDAIPLGKNGYQAQSAPQTILAAFPSETIKEEPLLNENGEENTTLNEPEPTNVASQQGIHYNQIGYSTVPDSINYSEETTTPSTQVPSEKSEEQSELEGLFNKVFNVPIRQAKAPSSLSVPLTDSNPSVTSLQDKQDSSIEQPLPFFSSTAQSMSSQNDNQRQIVQPAIPETPTQQLNFPSSPSQEQQHFSNLFSGINRFANQQNGVAQRPTLPQTQTSPFQSPFQPQTPQQFPTGPGSGSPPPFPEPENGFNPFHLHENYPEPPYESEFANLPPLNDDFLEQSSRSAGSAQLPPPLNFAQSTLRNVRTEELLEVVRKKPVPPECAYNTISYGANGEDCLEARRKRQVKNHVLRK